MQEPLQPVVYLQYNKEKQREGMMLPTSIVNDEKSIFSRYLKIYEALYYSLDKPVTNKELDILWDVYNLYKNQITSPSYSSLQKYLEGKMKKGNIYKIVNSLEDKKFLLIENRQIILAPFLKNLELNEIDINVKMIMPDEDI